MNIRLHIEELLLDGLPLGDGDGPKVKAAVEKELARLIIEQGLSAELHAASPVARINGGDAQLMPAGNSANIGRVIAQSVFQGLAGVR